MYQIVKRARVADAFLCCGLIAIGIGWILGRRLPKLASKWYDEEIEELCRMYNI